MTAEKNLSPEERKAKLMDKQNDMIILMNNLFPETAEQWTAQVHGGPILGMMLPIEDDNNLQTVIAERLKKSGCTPKIQTFGNMLSIVFTEADVEKMLNDPKLMQFHKQQPEVIQTTPKDFKAQARDAREAGQKIEQQKAPSQDMESLKDAIDTQLGEYYEERFKNKNEYKTEILGIGFGKSRTDKLEAVDALTEALLGDSGKLNNKKEFYKEILNDGTLKTRLDKVIKAANNPEIKSINDLVENLSKTNQNTLSAK